MGQERSPRDTDDQTTRAFRALQCGTHHGKTPAARCAHNQSGSCRSDIGLGNAPGSCRLTTLRQAAGIVLGLTPRRADPPSAVDANSAAVELSSVPSLGSDCTWVRRSFAEAGHQRANACERGRSPDRVIRLAGSIVEELAPPPTVLAGRGFTIETVVSIVSLSIGWNGCSRA